MKTGNDPSTQGYLRFEKKLGTQGSVDFDILSNLGAPTATEKRLNVNDTFTVTKLAIFTYKLPNGQVPSAQVLNTFPNPLVYAKSGEAANLMNIYHSNLSVRVNSKIYIDSLDVMRFYRVGFAQSGVAVSNAGAANITPASQWDGGDFGFYLIEPKITLSGASTNKITLTLPASLDMTGTTSDNYVVCYVRGILNQNAAQFN